MGVFQLPDDVDGDAAACLVYSFFCLLANAVLIWLIWTHHERTSYVAFISYFTGLATTSSIIQQLYDYILWRDIMTDQFFYGKEHAHDAETQYQRGIMGLKLALSYIRQFCFMVESSLVLFFSLSLAATVYGWWAKKPQFLRKLSIIGRIVPIALALVSTVLLQLEFTHHSFTPYFLIANAQLVLSLAGSSVFLVMILGKYVQTRRQLKSWKSIQYGKLSSTTSASKTAQSRRSRAYSTAGKPSATFDQWLVIRLSIAFMTLCVFEWTNIAPRIAAQSHIVESVDDTIPDLSERRAMATVTGYLSGVSPSLLAFVVFGTTKTFQRKMYKTFVPAAIRQKLSGRRRHGDPDDDDNDDDKYTRRPEGSLPFSSVARSSFARASTLVGTGPPPPPPPPDAKSIGSTSAPTTPRTITQGPRRVSVRSHGERTSFLLMPIQGSLAKHRRSATVSVVDDIESQALRRSQIGVAVSSTPEQLQTPQPAVLQTQTTRGRRAATLGTVGTFYRDDSLEDLGQQHQIPLSRFHVKNKHNTYSGAGATAPNNNNTSRSSSSGRLQKINNSSRQFPARPDSFGSTRTTTTTIWSESAARPLSGDNHHHPRASGQKPRFGSIS